MLDGTSTSAVKALAADAPTWLFGNFGFWVMATVFCQVFGGLVTALVIRYSDNIAKGQSYYCSHMMCLDTNAISVCHRLRYFSVYNHILRGWSHSLPFPSDSAVPDRMQRRSSRDILLQPA
jgi:hypothetical protein